MTMELPMAAADAHAAPTGPVALTARTHLARDGDIGDVEVIVTLDAGPPTLLYRRVLLPFRLGRPTPTASSMPSNAPS